LSGIPILPRMTLSEMLDEATSTVPLLGAREARRMLREVAEMVVLDVRDYEEYSRERIEGSLHISRGSLEFYVEDALPVKQRPLLVVSRAGARAMLAARTLQVFGYRAVWALEGGLEMWRERGYPVAQGPEPAEDGVSGG
jgi:rhodanese-related sulfurtransferase